MNVCILTIATNKYIAFFDRLYKDINNNFLNDHNIKHLLFTDSNLESNDNLKICKINHEPWPMPTLKRYEYFLKEKEFIYKFDYCYYFDVDMGVFDKIGDEVLGDMVFVQHPYQSFYSKEKRSYDRNLKSLAYVREGEEGENYYAGGFNGGLTKKFIKMSEKLAACITTDFSKNIIAVWHDESHMNRYLIDNSPTLTLNPSYCFPEEQIDNPRYPYKPKIVALKKNHNELRF